ncbi:MAG: hypothetical protein ABSB13_08265 [Candidatus Binatus sp.]|jgi:hypothetical protein|uniref:hypothetical protein n=1 Tax=Candidatus Binatus sp. TaxID=2811406 RepID=UPI003D116CF2
MPDEAKAQPATRFERTENFASSYANGVSFEPSAWDLKVIFGQLDQASGATIVKQHLAVTIPWAQAKLALFWLRIQVEAMEEQTGKIPLRKDVLPPEPPPLTAEQKSDPAAKRFYEAYVKAREQFIASL